LQYSLYWAGDEKSVNKAIWRNISQKSSKQCWI